MTTKFRNTHFLSIFKAYETQHLPLDVFLKKYFQSNHSIGSHDRKYLSELAYKMLRWEGLVSFFCKEDKSWEAKLNILQTLEPEAHLQNAAIPLHHRVSFPEKYFLFLCEQIGEEKTLEFCLESNFPAPTTIRANTIKTSRDDLLQRLQKNHNVIAGLFSPLAIHFPQRVNFLVLPEFKEGLFEVQDEASQLAALQVCAKPGDHVLDYCAGSGGKTLAIAPQMQGKGQIYITDIRSHILLEAKKRLKRAGIQNVQILDPDTRKKNSLRNNMDWVLVDAPCSGSGTLRRNPGMKWKFSQEDLQNTILLQRTIFAEALAFLKPKGKIVYTTCSVFPEENERQIEYFIKTHSLKQISPAFSSFPTRGGMDGFYSAILQKC